MSDVGWLQNAAKSIISQILGQFWRLPQHIGIVMDGNRRYAREHHKSRYQGHTSGFESMGRILAVAYGAGIAQVTVYAFSIENFNRSSEEVADLMDIARTRLKELIENGGLATKYGVRINIIGNLKLLPQDLQDLAAEVMESTNKNERAVLNLCMPYTARDDITRGVRLAAANNEPENITEDLISSYMYTNETRPLDLLIRTSGTYRLSDFLLWEITDSTYIDFVSELWPEYTPWCFLKSILRWSYWAKTHDKNRKEIDDPQKQS